MSTLGAEVGTVVGNTSPQEYRFYLRSFAAKLGDLVSVAIEVPGENKKESVDVWGRITSMTRYNPFLPTEAGLELAEEGLELIDTVLSNSRDQIEGTVLVLGATRGGDYHVMTPLNYPVQPGAVVRLPPSEAVKTILTGDDTATHRLRIGTLIGRSDVPVSIKTNVLVARHMAILAMTGGGKTVAARRVIRELIEARYPVIVLDPHGDYLGIWEKRELFTDTVVKLYYPAINVSDRNRDVIGFLVGQMTQGFTDPQRDEFGKALEQVNVREEEEIPISAFLDKVIGLLPRGSGTNVRTIGAVRRGLKMVQKQMDAMMNSNETLRKRLREFDFEAMPDPFVAPERFIRPGQVSILYLGGYDHLTQSTIVSLVLRNLYEVRASMKNQIPPFLSVVEEAHNFIPSRGEGQADTPSVEIIRKVITEGRKFGVGLLLISQRPSRLDETTLSQCNTFLVFRLVNPRDQSFVEKVMENLSKADGRLLPGFGPGEGIVSGQAVRFPLLVKVDWDEDLQPTAIGDEDFVDAVSRWADTTEGRASDRAAEFHEKLRHAGYAGGESALGE